MFGTCAGLILLAKRMVGYDEPHIGVMDVTVERNSFGRQVESFEADLDITGCCREIFQQYLFVRLISLRQEKSRSSFQA